MTAQLSNFSSAQDTNNLLVLSLGLDLDFERDALMIELYKGGYVFATPGRSQTGVEKSGRFVRPIGLLPFPRDLET